MRTIIVDDDRSSVDSLLSLLSQVDPEGKHKGVISADDFMEHIRSDDVDVAFIDVNLQGADGLVLAEQLSRTAPELNVIMYTAHPEYKAEAMDLFVSGYLVKPVAKADLELALAHLRYPVKVVRVQCFGNFEIFVNDTPLKFVRKDSKEVFAYLTDRRGAYVSEETIRYLLWSEEEDNEKKRVYVRNIIYDIRNTFSAVGIEDIIISHQGCYGINTGKIKCDYYDWLCGKNVPSAKLREYMEQFSSWSIRTKNTIFLDR